MPVDSLTSPQLSQILRALPGVNLFLLPDAPVFTILEASDSYLAATNTRREQLLGKGLFEAFPDHPDRSSADRTTMVMESLQQVIAEKVPNQQQVVRYDLPDKTTGKMEVRYWLPVYTPVLNEDGSVQFIINSVEDVTRRVLLEQEEQHSRIRLRTNEQQYFSLFQQNPDAVFSFDLDGNLINGNRALEELTECPLEEIYRTSFGPFVAPADLEKTWYHFTEATRGNPQRYEVNMVTATGRHRTLDITNLPIVVEGKIAGVYGIAKDITETVTAREELLKSNRRFEMVAKVTHDAIYDWDLQTNELNRAESGFISLFGYTNRSFPAPETWLSLIHPEDLDRVLKKFRLALEDTDKQTVEQTYRLKKADGSYAYISDRGYIDRDENGKAIHFYGALNDITTKVKYEEEREALIRELTQTNLDLKQFSYITSHNLRTPIANLISLGDLMDDTKIGDPLTRTLLEKYKQTARKLNENVNDLLEELVIKLNREVQIKEIELDATFREVTDSIENYIADSDAEIRTDFEAGNLVRFNPGYMQSILLNLLTNAIKYRSPERKLQIDVKTEDQDGQLLLHFSDNGLGIDLSRYGKRIFGMYQKFHDHPESKGLGLHIIASQIKAMGAGITIKSNLNQGTTFTIQFNNRL